RVAPALAVAGVHGHVQAGVAHRLVRGAEPPAVAQLGPDGDRGDRSYAVVGLPQGPAARLRLGQAGQLPLQFGQLGVDVVDHAVADTQLPHAGRSEVGLVQ